jgi:hypothetical protein
MKKIVVLSIMLCAFYFTGLCQKVDGPVLKKELIGKYDGDQKKGLANGKGTAIGRDSYTGEFKKGLPEGEGIYTDSVGNIYKGSFHLGKKEGKGEFTPNPTSNEKPMVGYWQEDKYVGKEKIDPYVITNKTGSVSPRIYSTGPGNKIEIDVLDPYDNSLIDANIFTIGQGNSRNDSSYHKYFCEDTVFPIEFDISYNCRTKLGGAAMVANTIRIKINKPGCWMITLKN